MIKTLYDMWKEIAGISAALMVLVNIFLRSKNNEVTSAAVRKTKDIVSYLLSVVIVGCLLVGLSYTKIPNVRGKMVSEAEQILSDNHINMVLQSGYERNSETYRMTVVDQSEDTGSLVLRGRAITVYIATNEETYRYQQKMTTVPNVTGMPYEEAVQVLRDNSINYRIAAHEGTLVDLETAYVVNQSFFQGLTIPVGSAIDLTLSSSVEESVEPISSETMVVPDVIGMNLDAATDLLLTSGFYEVSVSGDWSDGQIGYVLSQSIPAGTEVFKGLRIELDAITKELGSSVVVPSVVGMEQTEATRLLTSAGLQFQVWWTEASNVSAGNYYVIDQSIPASSSVPAGTLVKLEISPNKP